MISLGKYGNKLRSLLKTLGPGLITGASDDDPSGIATYSQAGAGFGMSTLWAAIFTFPLMAAIQEMCARLGIVTSKGLTSIIKEHYPRTILYILLLSSFPAIILNIGADIAGMGAVANLLVPSVHPVIFNVIFTAGLIFLIIRLPYRKIANVLKYLCLSLLLYMIVPFLHHQDWIAIGKNTILPHIKFNKEYVSIIVAILGTTISPYLFFWQTSMEVEEYGERAVSRFRTKYIIKDMRGDVDMGMLFSNLVMYFIILTTAIVLYNAGIRKIDTIEQAAQALRPLAGELSYLLFALGVLGTGLLAIPVLAGSLSYMFAETFDWKEGLNLKFKQAKPFYIVIVISMLIGLFINFLGISPVKALIFTAILYGLTAPIMIAIILHACNNKKIMGEYTNSLISNIFGFIALILMTTAAIALIYFEIF